MSPAGNIHHHYWKLFIVPTLAISTVLAGIASMWMASMGNFDLIGYILEFWLWFNLWYLAGRYVDPDLDILGVNMAEGRATRELGLFGVFFFGYSSFYAAMMNYLARKFHIKGIAGAHRSWLTHSPVGTIIRVLFINAPLVYANSLISGFLKATTGAGLTFGNADIFVFVLAQVLGLGEADGIHVYLDLKWSEDYGSNEE